MGVLVFERDACSPAAAQLCQRLFALPCTMVSHCTIHVHLEVILYVQQMRMQGNMFINWDTESV